jgi:hypothetical protein
MAMLADSLAFFGDHVGQRAGLEVQEVAARKTQVQALADAILPSR